MEPQPSTSAAAATSKPVVCEGDDHEPCNEVEAVVPSTSGEQQQEEQLFSLSAVTRKQIHQLFGATCRVKMERCPLPITAGNNGGGPTAEERPADLTTVAKVETTTGSSSSSEDDKVQVLPTPPAASKKKRRSRCTPKGAWTCKICGKRMKYGRSYVRHMRSHRGEKPFKCGECGKSFGANGDLTVHRRIHTGVWQFNCVFCERGFHQQSNLFRHLRLHTEEKPFFCVVTGCGESFRHSDSLKRHRRLIHLKKC